MTRSRRLRITGWCVLVSGILAGAMLYWNRTFANGPALDDTTALGYSRSLQHGMDVMMGASGRILTEWQQTLTSPLGEAALIVVSAGLFAAYFFRVAWVIDDDERERTERPDR